MTLNVNDVRFLTGPMSSWEPYRLRREDLIFTRYNGNPSLVGVCARVTSEHEELLVYPDKLIRVRLHRNLALPAFVEMIVHVGEARAFIDGKTKTSAGQVGISGADLKDVPVRLPPLNEQHRIVAKLETVQSNSRRARDALDAVPPLLEKLRQSILAAAFRGDLTKDWREKHPDVEPASELLKRIRIERRKKWEEAELAKMKAKGKSPTDDKWKTKYKEPESIDATGLPELPDGWCWTNVDTVLSGPEDLFDGPFGSALKTSDYQQSGVRVIRLENLANLEFRADKKTYISSAKFESLTRHAVRAGDIIFGSFVEETTRVCVLPELGGPAIAKADCFCVRPDSRILPADVLVFALSTRHARVELTQGIHGATRPRINTGQLRALRVPLPPIKEQKIMQDRIEAALAVVRRLSEGHDNVLANFTALDRAVLAKAFRGELVPQNSNDKPAETSLAREANGAAPRTKKNARKVRGEARS